MAYEFIKTENRDGVYIITMHDPPTRNALGPEMAKEVLECLDICIVLKSIERFND